MPWWVYVIASALGLLLLLLLILLLRCLGFFRRKHRGDADADDFDDELEGPEKEKMMLQAETIKSRGDG